MHHRESSSITLDLKNHPIPKSKFKRKIVENTTIIAHENTSIIAHEIKKLPRNSTYQNQKNKTKEKKNNSINFEKATLV